MSEIKGLDWEDVPESESGAKPEGHYDEIPPYLLEGGTSRKVVKVFEGDEFPDRGTHFSFANFGPFGDTEVADMYWDKDVYEDEENTQPRAFDDLDSDVTAAVPAVRRAQELEVQDEKTQQAPEEGAA